MNTKLRKTLIAGAIAALITSPAWAGGERSEYPDESPQVETGQPMDTAPQIGVEPGAEPDLATPGPDVTDSPLYSRTPDELNGMEVVDAVGEGVGEVKSIVLGPDRESAHAVISMGGLLGLGATEIVVSLDELQQHEEDKLRIGATSEEIQGREEYMEELYVELEPDRPISEFSAFEPDPVEADPGAAEPSDADPGAVDLPEPPGAPQ